MKYKALILLAIGLIILTVLVLFIGPKNILNTLKMANPWYIMLAVIIQFLLFLLWTNRWAINIRVLGISIKKLPLIPMLLVGMAVNNITPSARGCGEPIRAYILGKYTKCPMEHSFATVVADRGLDTFPLFTLSAVTIIYAVLYLKLSFLQLFSLTFSLVLLLLLFLFGFYLSINKKLGEKVTLWILNILKRFNQKEA